MKHNSSKDLFDKYPKENSPEENAIVEGWYLNELKNSDFVPQRDMNAVQEEIWSEIKPVNKTQPMINWIGYAAAIVITVLLVVIFKPQEAFRKTSRIAKVTTDTVAQKDSVILASNTEKRMVKLTDGSVVILDKGSKLTILSAFSKYNREVELEGKAYFDIAHNPAKPFIVYTGSVRTTVLGTAFDITASPDLKSVKVNVIRGKVQVKNMKANWITNLKKNMQVVSGDSLMISRNVIDAEKELSWNSKEAIAFDDISFEDAKKLLEDRFQVKINLKNVELQKEKFSTSLRANESLDHFLKIICGFNKSEYTFNADSTVVSIKPLNH